MWLNSPRLQPLQLTIIFSKKFVQKSYFSFRIYLCSSTALNQNIANCNYQNKRLDFREYILILQKFWLNDFISTLYLALLSINMVLDSVHVLSSLMELIVNFSCMFYFRWSFEFQITFPSKLNLEIDLLITDRIFTTLMFLVYVIWENFTQSLLSDG